jgi:tRNA-splicing ligase RtcB (3'-phosphate/5'-hydroxy nucleic acid ligase)
MNLKKIDDCRWEIPKSGYMNVPGIIYSSERMIDKVIKEKAAEQVANVACLPGIINKSLAMPDVHWGYGFPIGGVAAFDVDKGVISPGGIGYDINCGVRLLRTSLTKEEIKNKRPDLVNTLFINIPSGVGSTGKLNLTSNEVRQVLEQGASWAVKKGYGEPEDLEHLEEKGTLEGADSADVSARALERGQEQLGTLGAGNHFLEIQIVDEIFNERAASVFGLFKDQVTIMIHTGSRGLGYQICDDYIDSFQKTVIKYGIKLQDRQLVCAPVKSAEGKKYYSAMCCGANYAWANRQIITHWIRESFMRVLEKSPKELGLEVVYDIAHNIGKFEEHNGNEVFIHRKGATRAFSPGHKDIPQDYREVGQPVIVPGTMGTESYVLVGTQKAMEETWGSTCHGAGRVMSRSQALKIARGEQVAKDLLQKSIIVKSDSWKTLAEEAPSAYKDVGEVIDVCHSSGISEKVARLKPLGVIKG